jgi:two-component system sensor histidine kinase BaeS
MPARSPRRLAVLVASDVAAAISDNPSLDLDAYVREQYGSVFQPFVVIMRDGRVVSNRGEIPVELQEATAVEPLPPDRVPREGRRVTRAPRRRPPPGARGGPAGAWEVAPILAERLPIGRVVVLATPPLPRIAREYGPTIAVIGLAALGAGILLIALFIFAPAQRRLKQLEAATGQLAAGNLDARAPEHGRDEVASVARAFNRMAAELAARATALGASERVRRQLLADVSHELATPLTAMRGYVETLKMPGIALDQATRDRYLGVIADETQRLESLVGDLLDLARLEGGGGTLRRERIPVAALFDRVIARHERDLQMRGDRMVTEIGAGAAFVEGDPDRLEQALQNLAANALRHTRAGTAIVLASHLDEGGRLHLLVRDNGGGIPEEHLPSIFDRFYKADAARQAAGGSGLGLSIVKAIVERHGGTITARNDGGAVFDIELPRPG